MKYDAVDSEIKNWADRNSLFLFKDFVGREERFCYLSNREGDCMQIWVEEPTNGNVTVTVSSVELPDGEDEICQKFVFSTKQIDLALNDALVFAKTSLGLI